MKTKLPLLFDVGFGNCVPRDRVVALVGQDSEPLRQLVGELEKSQRVIDATRGRKVKTVVMLDNGFAVLSAIARETLTDRFEGRGFGRPQAEVTVPNDFESLDL